MNDDNPQATTQNNIPVFISTGLLGTLGIGSFGQEAGMLSIKTGPQQGRNSA